MLKERSLRLLIKNLFGYKLSLKSILFFIAFVIILFSSFTSFFIYFQYRTTQSFKIDYIENQKNMHQYYISAFNSGLKDSNTTRFDRISKAFDKNMSALLHGGTIVSAFNESNMILVSPSPEVEITTLLQSINTKWEDLKNFLSDKSGKTITFKNRALFTEKNDSIHADFNSLVKIYKNSFENTFIRLLLLQSLISFLGIFAIYYLLNSSSRLAIAEKKIASYQQRENTSVIEKKERLKEFDELERSNKDLEGFAHIASHDLKEPLRMVTSYAELFQERYQDTLDEKYSKYLGYIIDGSKRMLVLIDDLKY